MSVETSWFFVSDPIHIAHRLIAIKPSPASLALAALAFRPIVFLETILEMGNTTCCLVLISISFRVKEFINFFFFSTISRI